MMHRPSLNFRKPAKMIHRGLAGLTLVELLLGLGIMAAMGGSVYMVYANAVRIDTQSRLAGEFSFESYIIFKAIEDDLGDFVNYRYKRPGDMEERLALSGQEDALGFVRESPDGLQWVSYELDTPAVSVVRKTVMGRHYKTNTDQLLDLKQTDGPFKQMIRKRIAFNGMPPEYQVLPEGRMVSGRMPDGGLKFFYAQNSDSNGLTWSNQWHQLDSPAVIRVVLRLSKGASGRTAEFSRDFLLPVGI